MRPVAALLGPTASGKSAVAMEIARQAGAEIISVDSMQV
ncbi:MAG: tRNA (adenosine(37)-N6)-dimethylallyltransferase MiaA, partial [Actinobacteria bacterium]|nr:tRNA (adenosine(37)-N6)-dimethylallyltransferase MiaA [Actinomycetota bacterium]NIS37314.1 tRNA (adenosine(37)-N6)-dimethylallyltransferase MiaA [Actinomycetota bacterium]NIT99213.1 tRNA (adenosine(37)-N6)-dimethylallyltransferase MiaA [Actinomycetota bacterium]NIU22813.1 tRNA (adenosine(37)-N6)-dimethylallyltransferase MiaA [Actinomycetota bacterium]NIU71755.1 tRNA (adenosine(37)-N6)-dimethylallyltransferase MiaA [Actinomycetota bacterium]